MRFFSLFLLASFLLALSFLQILPVYDFGVEKTQVFSESRIIGTEKMTMHFQEPKNTWYIGVKKSNQFGDSHDFCLKIFSSDSDFKKECLDFDGTDDTDEFFTFPLSLKDATKKITFQIETPKTLNAKDIVLYSMNTQSQGFRIGFGFSKTTAETGIISRADWGADETMRYSDSPYWKEKYASYLNYVKRPKTQAELDAIYLDNARIDFLKKNFGDTAFTVSLKRTENGRPLVWPIQKVKKVDKIILHHTAESLDTDASDEEMLRSIYAYHTLSRQWGDIGYNYIIGQRGKIYEGRAGGDYVVASHAAYNNMGSVGISTIGNFDKVHLNRDQQAGLEGAIRMMARKYGITLSEKTSAVRLCNTATCSPLQKISVSSLLGHKDVGTTACPGENIYENIDFWKNTLNTFFTPVLNTASVSIDPIPAHEKINMTPVAGGIAPATPAPQPSPQNIPITRYIGQKFRVKLSYPNNENITLSVYGAGTGRVLLDGKISYLQAGKNIVVGKVGNDRLEVNIGGNIVSAKNIRLSHTVVAIDSWKRIPAWDTKGTYNDNLFRDTISVRNIDGNLLITNELPLEWYIKGMGEVSNTDPVEKIKTIAVAARSYARHYMDPKNRKYNTNLYDGSDDPDSFQKYLGYSYEKRSPNVSRAVDATRGLMIFHNSVLIKPWYFTSSDGMTRSYKEYCESNGGKDCQDIAYLQSISDPAGVGKIRLGHGVGISGVGATYMANLGKSYTEIIQYYLKGVEIKKK